MSSARYTIPVVLFVTSIDLLVAQLLVVWNRWRVIHDHPPAITPGYGMRAFLYTVLVIVAAFVLKWVHRVSQSRVIRIVATSLFTVLVARALFFGPLYPWGARDIAEFAVAKGGVEIVANEGRRYYQTHGRIAASLAEMNLPENVTRDPWGYRLGYVRSGNGFRVFVRGAPG